MSDQPTEADYAQDDAEEDRHPDECAGEITASEVELDLAPFDDEDGHQTAGEGEGRE